MKVARHSICLSLNMKKIIIFIITVQIIIICGCEPYSVKTNTQPSSSTSRKEIDDAILQEVNESINEALDNSGFAKLVPSQSGVNAPSNPALQIIDLAVEPPERHSEFCHINVTVKNKTNTTITKVFVYFAILDKDGNILETDLAGDSIRVLPDKSITLSTGREMKDGSYSVIVDHYDYYIGDNKWYEEYVDNSPVAYIHKITHLITMNPTYPEAVTILGDPDLEDLSYDITEIVYKQNHEFYGLIGTLYVGFSHSPSSNARTEDTFIGLGYMAKGEDVDLSTAQERIINDYDTLFGSHDYDESNNMYSWKDKQRNTINLQIDDGFLIFGCGSYYNNPFNF